jgi:hypothetical protein
MNPSELQSESYNADQLMENVERVRRFDSGGITSGAEKQSDRDLLIAAYANFNSRSIDAILAVMHPGRMDWNADAFTAIKGYASTGPASGS